jgi:hypothetical protein
MPSLGGQIMAHHPGFFITYIYAILLFCNGSQHQAVMPSSGGDDDIVGLPLWVEQDPDFKAHFPVQAKREFKSMHEGDQIRQIRQ